MCSEQAEPSEAMLIRLLGCLCYRLEVQASLVSLPEGAIGYEERVRYAAVPVALTRSERRSWRLHRQLATHLDAAALRAWAPHIAENLRGLAGAVRGEPHRTSLERWERLVTEGDVAGLRAVMCGVHAEAIAMREVSPCAGLLPHDERALVLGEED